MSDFPEYSTQGKIGLAVLHAHWASAVFYCEDDLHEAFYDRLIKRILPDIKPYFVVCLGGKSEVLKVAKTKDKVPSVTEICIIDKDYDDLLEEIKSDTPVKLIYLRKHSIENYLSQKEALVTIAIECRAKNYISRNEIEDLLSDFQNFSNKLVNKLVEIGRYFILARKYRVEIQTSKTPSNDIYLNASPIFPLPTDLWFNCYKSKFSDACARSHDWLNDSNLLQASLQDAFQNKYTEFSLLEPADHVVGKHLLNGFLRYIGVRFKVNLLDIDPVELYTRLVSHISISDLSYLRTEVLNVDSKLVQFAH
jgi:Protein of unknown function (DUF4435)